MSRIDSILSLAKSYIGTAEGSDKHKQIIDLYNKARYSDAYKMTMNDPWCAAFVVAMFQAYNASDIIPCYAACFQMINIFKKWGRWHDKKGYTPKIGDIIFYNWDGDAVSDHVGIVSQNQFGDLSVIEGNKSDAVGYRNINYNNSCIMGYGSPNYDGTGGSDSTQSSGSKYEAYFSRLQYDDQRTIKTFPILYKTSKGVFVKILQIFLCYFGKYELDVDGDFGPITDSFVRKWQESKKLEVDGQVGNETWSSFFA